MAKFHIKCLPAFRCLEKIWLLKLAIIEKFEMAFNLRYVPTGVLIQSGAMILNLPVKGEQDNELVECALF